MKPTQDTTKYAGTPDMPDMEGRENTARHSASVVVRAPTERVYRMFTHFEDFPKYMTYVKEVTHYDNARSHWAADIVGHHEWDAINTDWIEGRQVGWRSTDGFENEGRVTFDDLGDGRTRVTVAIAYNPPAGILGDAGEALGAGNAFKEALQRDLDNFARMAEQEPGQGVERLAA